MVKQGFVKKKGFRTLITFRGKIYRITKHYTFGLWTFILGLVIGLFSPEINFKKNNNNAVSPTLLPKEVDSLSMHDSGHQKTYQILSDPYKDHTDTTKRDTASAKPVSRLTRHK